jgi:hypothetical protein
VLALTESPDRPTQSAEMITVNRVGRRRVCLDAATFHMNRAGCRVLCFQNVIDSLPEYCLSDHRTRS